ncbi:Tannase/feruloyl esterase [Aspergillus pseudoustus]|uniref:Carboxylic ester hydrolase n=1 Tax=Aspergillus pseudoustus TaxID=1810923 RepID=A0ABR4JJ48_9EURO
MDIWNFNTPVAMTPMALTHLCSPATIPPPKVPGAEILDMTITQVRNYSAATDEFWDSPERHITGLDICNVTVTYTHPGWGDIIHVETWLPLSGWNGRFQAASGGGWVTGRKEGLALRAWEGYSVSVTDGGHAEESGPDDWALNSDGSVNMYLLRNFASVALHELAVIGKQLVASFYGTPPAFSYWNGCSTGGRQGLMLAQQFPGDFNGIVAVAPAINWADFIPADFWPQLLMNQMGVYPEQCEFEALRQEAIRACDRLDGVQDHILSAPGACEFDPLSVVGLPYECGGVLRTISKEAAVLASNIWEGPHASDGSRRWYGLNHEASPWLLPGTECARHQGTTRCHGKPFWIAEEWLRLFVLNDQDFDLATLSFAQYDALFDKSRAMYDAIIGTASADLSAFRDAGGKMITWHGLADEAIFANGSSQYYQRVLEQDSDAANFFRYFEAPGVAHCRESTSAGPYPRDVLKDLIAWVEDGRAPETLRGEWTDPTSQAVIMRRELCQWPLVASSFTDFQEAVFKETHALLTRKRLASMILSRIWQGLLFTGCAATAQLQQVLCDRADCQPNATGLAADRGVPSIQDMVNQEQVCNAPRFDALDIDGATFLSITAIQNNNYTFQTQPELGFPADPSLPVNICNVTVTYTHAGWNDEIRVSVYLPSDRWNGPFLATGGAGYVTGAGSLASLFVTPGLADGYAVATTDGGHIDTPDAFTSVHSWALSSPGNVNWPLLVDFAKVALHDMAEIGKAVTTAYYGVPPHHSYYQGGSTGGRQGVMFAQSYPHDFDGIIAIYPAINWAEFVIADYWPQFIMNQLNVFPRPCELEAITKTAIVACDKLDGVEDGIISLPGLCDFNATTLVGKAFDCNGEPATFTSAAATIANAAWTGPRSATGDWQWFGVAKDADLGSRGVGVAKTSCASAEGKTSQCTGEPFGIASEWLLYFLLRDPDFDLATITHEKWDSLFHVSIDQYQSVLGTANADLSEFRKAGGKMLSWHGMRDEVIPVNGSVQYYDRVLALDPAVHDYFRLFLVPGAGHWLEGGPTPKGVLEAVVKWVEEGAAPETLRGVGEDGRGTVVQRDLCMYPRIQVYMSGDPAEHSSFTCTE